MSCQCLFLPRQEIRECICSWRTQQHSHGNASSSFSVPPSTQQNETVQLPPSLRWASAPIKHPRPFFFLLMYFPRLFCRLLLWKSPYPHIVSIWRSDVLFLWCVGTHWVCCRSQRLQDVLILAHVCDRALCLCAITNCMHHAVRSMLEPCHW